MADRIGGGGDFQRGTQVDARVSGLLARRDIDRTEGGRSIGTRIRQKIPTMADLEKLMVNGVLMLPSRYIRGFFLDVLV